VEIGGEEHVPLLRRTNEVIGAYVTDGAKIHLYRYLYRLRENALYCDTKSLIYIQPRGEAKLIEEEKQFGSTSKLRPSKAILEFVSNGAKYYA